MGVLSLAGGLFGLLRFVCLCYRCLGVLFCMVFSDVLSSYGAAVFLLGRCFF